MTDEDTEPTLPRGPVQGLADLSQLMAGQPKGMSTFLRGLIFGAFVGAAIAGSAIWRRRNKEAAERERQGP